MDKSYRVAVASSDGIVVNQHFGHAEIFYIYMITADDIEKERTVRHMKAVCHLGDHDDKQLEKNMQKLQDCKYLLVSRIGNGAAIQAEKLGITPMELPGLITESLERLISYTQIQNLLERN